MRSATVSSRSLMQYAESAASHTCSHLSSDTPVLSSIRNSAGCSSRVKRVPTTGVMSRMTRSIWHTDT